MLVSFELLRKFNNLRRALIAAPPVEYFTSSRCIHISAETPLFLPNPLKVFLFFLV